MTLGDGSMHSQTHDGLANLRSGANQRVDRSTPADDR
jgi:hypothetical protein